MKKTIAWIGCLALLTVAGTVALLTDAGAEAGDQIYVHKVHYGPDNYLVLGVSQKLNLRNALVAKWPAIEGHADRVTKHYCMRDCKDLVAGTECRTMCEVCWEVQASAVDYLALKNAGRAGRRLSNVDDPVDFERCSARTETTGDALGTLAVYVESLGDFDVATSIDVRTERVDTEIVVVAYNDIRVATPDGYMALERQGRVGRDLGAVVEE